MDTNSKKTQEISQRIDQIRQYFCNGVNIDFADKIGKDPTYTSQLCTGTKSIGNKIIEKILETFPEVSKSWLYLGEGEMLRTEIQHNEQQNVSIGGDNIVNGSSKTTSEGLLAVMELVMSQQKTIQDLTEQNKMLTRMIAER